MSAADQAREVPWKPKHNPWAIAVVVTFAAFMEILDTTVVNVALPHIAGSLSVSNDEATWALTSYLVANAIVLTISGWLSAVIGRKRYFLICLSMFTVCSFLCGIANSLPQLVIFRLMQGFFGGGMQPTQMSIVLDTFPPQKRGAAFGVTAIATIVAPVLGPALGGFVTDHYDWRWIFFVNLPVGLIAVFFVSVLVEDPPWHPRISRHVDFIGLSLITLGLGCMQVMLDRGEEKDWLGSPFIRVMAILATLGIFGAIGWLLIAKKPIVDLHVFKDRNFAMGCVCIAATGAVLYSGAVVIPLFTQSIIGYNATWSGLILSPGGIIVILLIPIIGQLMRVMQTRFIIAAGFFIMGCAFVYSSTLTPSIDFKTLVIMRSAQTAGLAFLFVPISTIAYTTLPRELNGDATALFAMFRNVFGSIGISVSTAMITERTQIHQSYLANWANPFHQPFNELIANYERSLTAMGRAASSVHDIAVGQAYQAFRIQAAVLAYSDVFLLAGVVAFAVVPFCFFLSHKKGAVVAPRISNIASAAKNGTLAAMLALLALPGCSAVGPDFEAPDPLLPRVSFFGKPGPSAVADGAPAASAKGDVLPVDPNWWAAFRDPILTSLAERVAAANLDVNSATLKLAESRSQLGVVASAALPAINGDASYQRELLSQNGVISLAKLALPPGRPFVVPPISIYQPGFDASWEFDLWGHVRRQIEAAGAQVEAAENQRRDMLVSTLAELARDYIQLRGVQAQIAISNENLNTANDILQLTKTRAARGLTTQLDVENAAAEAASIRAQLPGLENQESMEINALSLLLDEPPGSLRSELARAKPVPPVPPRVPLGIASELARRRPDIRAAEAQLHAATADIGVAVADFYPSVKFNGTVGFNSLDLKDLWKGSSLQYVLGPSLSIPIFDGGRLKSTLELREIQQQDAAITYHKTVLQAWHEVVNALVAYRTEQQRRTRVKDQVGHSRRALALSRTRYDTGVTDFISVLDAERTLLQAELQHAQSTTNVSTNLVQLYKALGGGWEQTFPEEPAMSVVNLQSVQ